MVYALKDTNIQSSIMVTKSSNVPVATGVVTNSTDLSNLYMVSSVQELVSIDKIVLAPADNKSVSVYHVASIDLIPGASATINTTDGRTIVVDSSGIYEAPSVSPTGRRLLVSNGSSVEPPPLGDPYIGTRINKHGQLVVTFPNPFCDAFPNLCRK